MKIVRFVMSSEMGFFIDLEDKSSAVTVTPNTGDVILQQGQGLKRINNFIIPGLSTLGFDLIRVKGESTVIARYKSGTLVRALELGITADSESASSWIERVNKIYEKNNATLKERTEGFRVGRFYQAPAIHDILAERQNIIMAGDYLFSAEPLPHPENLQPWEEFYVNRAVNRLKEYSGFTGEIENIPLKRIAHNYKWLNERVRYSPKFYQHRITQPLEHIFDREPRHDQVGVIPFGSTEYFAMVYFKGQNPARHFDARRQEPVAGSFWQWVDMLSESLPDGAKVLICTPSNQSVEYSVVDMFPHGNLDMNQWESLPYIGNQASWLCSNSNRGIIACDIGVAYQIIHYMNNNRIPGAESVDFCLVPYEMTVHTGLCYRVDDPEWGKLCHNALLDTLSTKDERVRSSLEKSKEQAKK